MISAPMLGSHAPVDVSQCALLPDVLESIFTHISAFFIMNVPVRMSVPCPVTVAWLVCELEIVALPSMKIVPCTRSCSGPSPCAGHGVFVPFHKSWPARDLHAYCTPFGVRSTAALAAGVALLLRSRSAIPEAVSNPFGNTDDGSEVPPVHGESGPRSAGR